MHNLSKKKKKKTQTFVCHLTDIQISKRCTYLVKVFVIVHNTNSHSNELSISSVRTRIIKNLSRPSLTNRKLIINRNLKNFQRKHATCNIYLMLTLPLKCNIRLCNFAIANNSLSQIIHSLFSQVKSNRYRKACKQNGDEQYMNLSDN